jgi:uncharacterized protein
MDLSILRQRLAHEKKLVLNIRAVPKSPAAGWGGQMADGVYKVRVHSAPERGKANEEIVEFLAAEFGVRRSAITIVAGATSQNKMIKIQI